MFGPSKKMVVIRRCDKEYDLSKRGKPWPPRDVDLLMEWYCEKGPTGMLGPNGLVARFHRSPDGISSILCKFVTRYPYHHYKPRLRTRRDCLHWTWGENHIIYRATERTGCRNKAHTPEYIALLVQRTPEAVKKHCSDLVRSSLPTLFDQLEVKPVRALSDEELAVKVHGVLHHMNTEYNKAIKEIKRMLGNK